MKPIETGAGVVSGSFASRKFATPPVAVANKASAEGQVKSCARVIDVLEFFHERAAPAREVDIRAALNLAKSSANDLLKTLLQRGYVTLDPATRTYFPSFRLAKFGGWLSNFYFGGDKLSRMMQELSEETGEVVILSAPRECAMQILSIEQKTHSYDYMEGQFIDIVNTATGRACLMTKTDSEIIRIARRAARFRPQDKSPAALDRVFKMIKAFQQQHYSVSPSNEGQAITIGVPLPHGKTPIPLYVGIGGPAGSINSRQADIAQAIFSAVERNLH
jgi:DNA-binding IclR family transcriptional regulator